jgi:hypothetical protein
MTGCSYFGAALASKLQPVSLDLLALADEVIE